MKDFRTNITRRIVSQKNRVGEVFEYVRYMLHYKDPATNNQNELFGNDATYADGFANLKQYDSNNDNQMTSTDAQWSIHLLSKLFCQMVLLLI